MGGVGGRTCLAEEDADIVHIVRGQVGEGVAASAEKGNVGLRVVAKGAVHQLRRADAVGVHLLQQRRVGRIEAPLEARDQRCAVLGALGIERRNLRGGFGHRLFAKHGQALLSGGTDGCWMRRRGCADPHAKSG